MFTQYSYVIISLLPKLNPEFWDEALLPGLLSLEGEDGFGGGVVGRAFTQAYLECKTVSWKKRKKWMKIRVVKRQTFEDDLAACLRLSSSPLRIGGEEHY